MQLEEIQIKYGLFTCSQTPRKYQMEDIHSAMKALHYVEKWQIFLDLQLFILNVLFRLFIQFQMHELHSYWKKDGQVKFSIKTSRV